ncbi:hypothetical protein A9Q99_14360 [Gammaproteobacteria bacterium 45_16_T64]|nr:hypothetical protein A9Q99_14360 [Gammaproteobacteria bacterium 45_16_T64]
MIDISDVHMIKVVTELGSINRAADVLCMSQPTLSKKISRLEDKINLKLFSRQNSGMTPTSAANLLMRKAPTLESCLQSLERELELMAGMVNATINIGVGPIVEQIILPNVLLDFVEKDLPFKISVVTESPETLLKQLEGSEIDLAIGPFKSDKIGEQYNAVLGAEEPLVIAVRPEHPLMEWVGHRDFGRQLSEYKFVSPNVPQQMGVGFLDTLAEFDISSTIVSDNYSLAKTIVCNSNYATAGPVSLFRSEFERGQLSKLTFPKPIMWHCSCLAKPEILLSPAVAEVVQLFSQYMSPITE